jgi:class 3 adenylate cyclase
MRRYLFIALVIGAIGVLTTSLLFEFGVLSRFADKLATYYANAGWISQGQRVDRVLHTGVFVLSSFAMAWAVVDIPKLLHKGIIVIGTALLLLALSFTLAIFGIFFEPFSSMVAVLVATSLGLVYSLTEPGSRKRRLHRYLGGRVSESACARLMEVPNLPFLRGQNLQVTAVTLRIFNLARLREEMSATNILEITNLFLRNSGEFLAGRGGYLDESSPECVRAYFGILTAGENHATAACQAALELRQRLSNLNQLLETRYFQRLDYGMAINTDAMTVGIYESENAARLSATGELIDYTRRVAGANSDYGSAVLLGGSTYALVRQEFAARPMELIYDARHDVMSEVYELVDRQDALAPEDDQAIKDFWQAVIYYREGRAEEALLIFSQLRSKRASDRPLQYFIERAQARLLETSDHSGPSGDLFMRHGHARILQSL